jgi:hypothetical protein
MVANIGTWLPNCTAANVIIIGSLRMQLDLYQTISVCNSAVVWSNHGFIYNKPSLIRSSWGGGVIQVSEAAGSPKRQEKKILWAEINGQCNDISRAEENKFEKNHSSLYLKKKTNTILRSCSCLWMQWFGFHETVEFRLSRRVMSAFLNASSCLLKCSWTFSISWAGLSDIQMNCNWIREGLLCS